MNYYLLGWVVGFTYTDGGEWLTRGNEWCALGTKKGSRATIYKTQAKAKKQAEKLQQSSEFPFFYREYILESEYNRDWPVCNNPNKYFVNV